MNYHEWISLVVYVKNTPFKVSGADSEENKIYKLIN